MHKLRFLIFFVAVSLSSLTSCGLLKKGCNCPKAKTAAIPNPSSENEYEQSDLA